MPETHCGNCGANEDDEHAPDCAQVRPPLDRRCLCGHLSGNHLDAAPRACTLCSSCPTFRSVKDALAKSFSTTEAQLVDMVNHPPHYRSPVTCPNCSHPIECIDVIEHITDGRLFTAMKYLWRVALGGGKADDREDVDKARWYIMR